MRLTSNTASGHTRSQSPLPSHFFRSTTGKKTPGSCLQTGNELLTCVSREGRPALHRIVEVARVLPSSWPTSPDSSNRRCEMLSCRQQVNPARLRIQTPLVLHANVSLRKRGARPMVLRGFRSLRKSRPLLSSARSRPLMKSIVTREAFDSPSA